MNVHGADTRAQPAIAVEGLTVRFGRNLVLDGLDLEVLPGTTTVMLGPNGAGKSTLLRCLLGTLKPAAGELSVLGLEPTRRRNELLRQVGYVPDQPDVYPWMRVGDLHAFLRPHYRTWDPAYAAELLERLSVPRSQTFGKMSKGEGMKAMLATALAHRPDVLLLDEPFGGLDPLVREEVLRNVIGALDEGEGEGTTRTVLIATHDLEVAARVADRVAVLANGRIRREGPVDDIGIEVQREPTPAARRLHDALAVAAEEV